MILEIGVGLAVCLIVWVYETHIKPPAPKKFGTRRPNCPTLTSPRVELSDGRHLAYRELGVSKEEAQYKIIVCHGLDTSKDMDFPILQEVMEELKLYFLIYDRAGYCESDPNPSRTVKSEAFDIQELADRLELGQKFYIIGCSIGAYPVWACLKYIPHRLLGASLVVPMHNFWWKSLPSKLSGQSFRKLGESFRRTFWIAHHMPCLLNLWMKQKWFPVMSREGMFVDSDDTILDRLLARQEQKRVLQQGEHEAVHRDLMCYFKNWEFDPMKLSNPFLDNRGSVHIWQGSKDRVAPVELNRFITQNLTWIQYHELPNSGHLLIHEPEHCEAIIRELITPPKPSSFEE